MRWLVIAAVVALTACYQRAVGGACHVSCTSSACPSDLACGADGLCKSPGSLDCTAQAQLDGGSADARADSNTRGMDAFACAGTVYGTGLLQVCIVGTPPPTQTIGPLTEITDDSGTPIACTQIIKQTSGPEVCVIAMQQIDIAGTVRVAGSRAIAFVGTDSVTLESGAQIDVSSTTGGSSGAGSPGNCAASGGSGSTVGSGSGAGGGAGGTYGGLGGAGGSSSPGTGGSVAVTPGLVAVAGGCAGGNGGDSGGNTGGSGGAGGGAVYLIAGNQILIKGTINASGAGGTAPDPQSGGAGGGAGGLIALDGLSYDLGAAVMFAIGGPGSTGGGVNEVGLQTREAQSAGDAVCAPTPPPGAGSCGAGTGGDGLSAGSGYADPSANYGGGGGGGGGGGLIVAKGWTGLPPPGSVIIPPIGPMP